MGHKYVKEEDTFSTSQNGTVPKPSAQEVSDNKYLRADGTWKNPPGGGGGGGASSLTDLDDTNISSPTNGQVLKYNGTSSKWENANESGGSGHNYSTTEQVIGTWIDGKPLYEKTVKITNPAFDTYETYSTSLDIVVHYIQGGIHRSNGKYDGAFTGYSSLNNLNITVLEISKRTTGIEYVIPSVFQSDFVDLEFTYRYTKTTD